MRSLIGGIEVLSLSTPLLAALARGYGDLGLTQRLALAELEQRARRGDDYERVAQELWLLEFAVLSGWRPDCQFRYASAVRHHEAERLVAAED